MDIECRGKRTDKGGWVYGKSILVFQDKDTYMAECGDIRVLSDSNNNIFEIRDAIFFQVDPATVGMYIRKTDSCGTKIYIGDILSYTFGNRTEKFEVVWDDTGFNCKGFYNWYFDNPSAAFSEGMEDFTVIGNIHDNPELLEEAK